MAKNMLFFEITVARWKAGRCPSRWTAGPDVFPDRCLALPMDQPGRTIVAVDMKSGKQFVVQKHTNGPLVHWDLMFERGGALETYRLEISPEHLVQQPAAAVKILDHPLKFLTYEGKSRTPALINSWTRMRNAAGCRWTEGY